MKFFFVARKIQPVFAGRLRRYGNCHPGKFFAPLKTTRICQPQRNDEYKKRPLKAVFR